MRFFLVFSLLSLAISSAQADRHELVTGEGNSARCLYVESYYGDNGEVATLTTTTYQVELKSCFAIYDTSRTWVTVNGRRLCRIDTLAQYVDFGGEYPERIFPEFVGYDYSGKACR